MKNMARPEGNITGVATNAGETLGKWVELLHETVPTHLPPGGSARIGPGTRPPSRGNSRGGARRPILWGFQLALV